MTNTAYLILALPLVWVIVLAVRRFMGAGFKSKDTLAKDDVVAASRWQAELRDAQQRVEESKKAIIEQDEMDRHAERNEQVYPVRESRAERLKKEALGREEKGTVYPVRETKERHEPGK